MVSLGRSVAKSQANRASPRRGAQRRSFLMHTDKAL
jgi:hypothetical protein